MSINFFNAFKLRMSRNGISVVSTSEDRFPLDVLDAMMKERFFLIFLLIAFIFSAFVYQNSQWAMWTGFVFAAYSAVANDSIQTLGTFIETNKHRPWYFLWLFSGLIFLAVSIYSFIEFNGDVSYQRLTNPDGQTKYPHPDSFSYLQVIAPLILLMLTRLKMPVSTTFLLLSSFSADVSGISSVFYKSLSGYVIAFILSLIVWIVLYNWIRKHFSHRNAHPAWTIVQWCVSGSLWATWLMQDAANIAVYLPRQLSVGQFLGYCGIIFFGLGIIYYLKGDKIQGIVSEKSRIADVRAATLVDFTFVVMLIYKLFISTVPMSTTWVFLGVIGGREIAINWARRKQGNKHKKEALNIVGKDMLYALIGLVISIILAMGVNPMIRDEFMKALMFWQ